MTDQIKMRPSDLELSPEERNQIDQVVDLAKEKFVGTIDILVTGAANRTIVRHGGFLGRRIVAVYNFTDVAEREDNRDGINTIIESVAERAYRLGYLAAQSADVTEATG